MGTRDKVFLRGLRFFGRHGSLQAERELGQRFEVDVTIGADLQPAGRSDNLEDTVNYAQVFQLVKNTVEGQPRTLLERVAEDIATRVFESQPYARNVNVRICKPHVSLPGMFDAAGVEIFRERK